MSYFDRIELSKGTDVDKTSTLKYLSLLVFLNNSQQDNDCLEKFKPVFYKRYVDDIFVLFKRPEHVKPFVDYMNSKHKNIKIFLLKPKKMSKYPSLMSMYSVRMVSL